MKTSVICIGITGIVFTVADFCCGSGDNMYVISMLAVIGIWMMKDDNSKKTK